MEWGSEITKLEERFRCYLLKKKLKFIELLGIFKNWQLQKLENLVIKVKNWSPCLVSCNFFLVKLRRFNFFNLINKFRIRLRDGGPNSLPLSQECSTIKLYFKQYLHKFWIILLIAALLCFIVFGTNRFYGRLGTLNLYSGIILVAVVICMSTLSFWEQWKALRVVSTFKHLVPEKAYVIRDCIERYIDCKDIVVGDVVVIRLVDYV